MHERAMEIIRQSAFGERAGDDDQSLVKAAKLGDRLAFGLLTQRYRKLIRSVALRIMRNPDDADDAVQQTLMKALLPSAHVYWKAWRLDIDAINRADLVFDELAKPASVKSGSFLRVPTALVWRSSCSRSGRRSSHNLVATRRLSLA